MSQAMPTAVTETLMSIQDDSLRMDAFQLLELLRQGTGEDPELWNSNTIGFGRYHYRYATGKEGEFFDIGFAPRSGHLTLYVMSGLRGFEDILERLGPHVSSKSTVHLKGLADLDLDVLLELVRECVAHLRSVESELGAIPRMSEIPPRSKGDAS